MGKWGMYGSIPVWKIRKAYENKFSIVVSPLGKRALQCALKY
jgi:hypothetical protein